MTWSTPPVTPPRSSYILTFSFGNPAVVQDKTRMAAVHQAVAHAEAMAAAAGRTLGPVCSLTDNTQPTGLQLHGQGLNDAALPAFGRDGTAARARRPGGVGRGDDGLRPGPLSARRTIRTIA